MARTRWNGRYVSQVVRQAGVEALRDATEHLLEHSNRHVPHDEGTLERSGTASVDEAQLKGAVSFDTPYAARLHEHPEYNFQGKGRGKWLESALKEREQAIRDFIADRLRDALKG